MQCASYANHIPCFSVDEVGQDKFNRLYSIMQGVHSNQQPGFGQKPGCCARRRWGHRHWDQATATGSGRDTVRRVGAGLLPLV